MAEKVRRPGTKAGGEEMVVTVTRVMAATVVTGTTEATAPPEEGEEMEVRRGAPGPLETEEMGVMGD